MDPRLETIDKLLPRVVDAERELIFALAALSDDPDSAELVWLAACAAARAAELENQ